MVSAWADGTVRAAPTAAATAALTAHLEMGRRRPAVSFTLTPSQTDVTRERGIADEHRRRGAVGSVASVV